MMRPFLMALLIMSALGTSGCCLFQCYDGDPDPVEPLGTKRVPLQIANDVVFRLGAAVFHDESRTYTVYVEPPSEGGPKIAEAMGLIRHKLFREPHVKSTPPDKSEYVLSVKTVRSEAVAKAVFSLVRKGKIVWSYSEPMKGGTK